MIDSGISRRAFLVAGAALAAGIPLTRGQASAQARVVPILRRIPSSGEELPVIGLGTYIAFDVGSDPAERSGPAEVLRFFFDHGGKLIDTSPMYGRAEPVLGDLMQAMDPRPQVFAATKVWTDGRQAGVAQMETSMRRMGVSVLDLMQVHNLRDWQAHLPTLRAWKEEGRIRYVGITTSHGRDHREMEQLMRSEPLDFVQFSYSLDDLRAEERLLPLAAERGIATLVNRPFERGEMFRKTTGKPLPDWAAEFDCRSWAQFFLKFILANPAVTCIIPATSKPQHLQDNMGAGFGRLPDETQRAKMLEFYRAL
jgi:aryl-alcohol dehydrogenase-like predicted oxidoreductase